MNLQQWLEIIIGVAVTLSPVVAFLVAVVKTTAGESLQARYYPILSLSVGVVLALIVAYVSGLIALREAPLAGALAGGIASGLFQYGKSKEPTVTP